ncbi:MAG: adenine deaminase [Bacteroidales bacterium]|nr:adenine deaminase [Bacteroidales bacterium]
MKTQSFEGNIIDVVNKEIFPGVVTISNGYIKSLERKKTNSNKYISPGLVDAHIHIESSMLIPSRFAEIAVKHGTVATVSDPHEIANVLGTKGIDFMIENSKQVPFKFFFGAPSCVPATSFESSGAVIGEYEIEELLRRKDIKYLSEMMNYPGVLFDDTEVMAKLKLARKYGKPVDGHAPGLQAGEAKKYVESGISTDHECFNLEEALEKIKYGMKIQIREGSAAKNFETLIPLMKDHAGDIMFCSDDKHPDDLIRGHMNEIVKRTINKGFDPLEVIRVATYNPIRHYDLEVGLLQPGDPADFIILDNLNDFNVLETYINGQKVAGKGNSFILPEYSEKPNIFEAEKIEEKDIEVFDEKREIRVIKAIDGELITESFTASPLSIHGKVVSDVSRDILKLVVLNRYQKTAPAVAFINGFGIKKGAIASTVAHDSHNIIAVGTSDEELVNAINLVIDSKGGISLTEGEINQILPLPIAGIMSDENGYNVAGKYEKLDSTAKSLLGSGLKAPFMTLSFMALLVIPALKLSDKGLFDGNSFSFTSLYAI